MSKLTRSDPFWVWVLVLLPVAAGLALGGSAAADSVSCCSSWAVASNERHAVLRASVGEQGEVTEHVFFGGVTYKVAAFPLTITDVIKPSSVGEQAGDQLLLWVDASETLEGRATGPLRALEGQEAVFLIVTTEGQAYPEGYSLYAGVSYWTLDKERVTGGIDGIKLENAPYSALVRKVGAATGQESWWDAATRRILRGWLWGLPTLLLFPLALRVCLRRARAGR